MTARCCGVFLVAVFSRCCLPAVQDHSLLVAFRPDSNVRGQIPTLHEPAFGDQMQPN